MSCTSHTSQPQNSLDKGTDLFAPSLSDSQDLFDEFFSFDTFDHGDSIFPSLPELSGVVKLDGEHKSTGTSCTTSLEEELRQLLDHSQGELIPQIYEAGSQTAASPVPNGKPLDPSENIRTAEIAENELLSLGGVSLHSPHREATKSPSLLTPIPIITPVRRRSRFLEQISRTFKKSHRDPDVRQRSPIRKFTCPPKVMGETYTPKCLEDWQQQLMEEAPKFDFGFHDPLGPLSPPPTARIADVGNKMVTTTVEHPEDTFAWDHPLPQQFGGPHHEAYLDTPLATPTSESHTFSISKHSTSTGSFVLAPAPAPTPTAGNQDPSPWPESAASHVRTLASPFPLDSERDTEWWQINANTPLAQPAMYAAHEHNTAVSLTTPLCFGPAGLGLGESGVPAGLMIQMPNSCAPLQQQQRHTLRCQSFAGSGAASPRLQSGGPPGAGQPHLTTSPTTTPPRRNHERHNAHDILTSRPQPQSSPLARQRRSHSQTLSPCKPSSRAASSSSPSPRSSSAQFHISKRRSASQRRQESERSSAAAAAAVARSRSPREPRTPKSGSGPVPADGVSGGNGGTVVDFVNFTPSDSIKILTGVAPSGSSKTKARREREALEKRRRLSEAAMRAVKAAGGDIDRLVEEGFLD